MFSDRTPCLLVDDLVAVDARDSARTMADIFISEEGIYSLLLQTKAQRILKTLRWLGFEILNANISSLFITKLGTGAAQMSCLS